MLTISVHKEEAVNPYLLLKRFFERRVGKSINKEDVVKNFSVLERRRVILTLNKLVKFGVVTKTLDRGEVYYRLIGDEVGGSPVFAARVRETKRKVVGSSLERAGVL